MTHVKPTGDVCERPGVYRAGCEPDHLRHFERGAGVYTMLGL